ncbi:NitT/TauT family transport system substrate-binding protein [Tindallia magadiensis]|uniref:NitT/TauT family transport system substrate-binding protein n=1 Tax=Tindallia magadiensis TaxID=69895 RepID=A0A1I3DCC4_9FIRM|nr:aliphatic sulfonate ABC transporter substrate-binding protein [Tindallia magadiensis]SFH84420.1 NitT/TauT family transport system substrate-binding protein [Tindallia magadiensis]
MKKRAAVMILLVVSLLLAACSDAASEAETSEINIGYFPNLSHGPAMIGVENGYFEDSFNEINVNLQHFPNGSVFMDALSTGQIDVGYVGPGPVINRYLQGGNVVMIGNASRGENVLVVRNDLDYTNAKDLDGKIVATPSTGCTHDLLLRKMLQEEGMAVEENGGTVKRLAQAPASMMGLFEQKQIDAALVSEPWASLMEAQGIARVVVDADEVPWDGDLAASVLVARKDFLEENPDIVADFLEANEKSISYIAENQAKAVEKMVDHIEEITDQRLEKTVINSALDRVVYDSTVNPSILQEFSDLLLELGFAEDDSSLEGLFQ